MLAGVAGMADATQGLRVSELNRGATVPALALSPGWARRRPPTAPWPLPAFRLPSVTVRGQLPSSPAGAP